MFYQSSKTKETQNNDIQGNEIRSYVEEFSVVKLNSIISLSYRCTLYFLNKKFTT